MAQVHIKILKDPNANLISDGSGIVIIDDLVGSGKTMQLVKEMYPKAHYASVYAKPHGKKIVDTFITEVSQDTWIFFPWGYGITVCCSVSWRWLIVKIELLRKYMKTIHIYEKII